MISAASSAGDASMNLSGWNSAERGVAQAVLARERRGPADVAGEHPGALDLVQRPVERLRDRRLEQALAQPDPQLAAQHLHDARGRQRARSERAAPPGSPPSPPRPRPPRSPRTRPRPPGSGGLARRVGGVAGLLEHLAHRRRDVRGAVVGAPQRIGVRAGDPQDGGGRGPAQPTPIERWSASGNGRPVRNTAAIGSSSGVEAGEVVGRGSRSSRRSSSSPRRAPRSRSSGACARWYRVSADAPSALVPGSHRRRSRRASSPRAERTCATSCAGTRIPRSRA